MLGSRLRLDPDYPRVERFFPALIFDTVLEYRGYVFILPWAGFLAWLLPPYASWLLMILWVILAWIRAGYYRTSLLFWERCFIESPAKTRVRINYVEKMMEDLWRRYSLNPQGSPDTTGKSALWSEFEPEIKRIIELQDKICGVK